MNFTMSKFGCPPRVRLGLNPAPLLKDGYDGLADIGNGPLVFPVAACPDIDAVSARVLSGASLNFRVWP